jgi:hypothetical protein
MLQVFFIAFVFTGSILICIGYIIAATRERAWALKVKPQRKESFSTMLSPEESLKSIVRFAQSSDYKISNLDETENQALLEESASLWSWGFYFPVLVSKQPNGFTSIEVGIKSKFIQYGPIVSRSHKRCINGIKAALNEKINPTENQCKNHSTTANLSLSSNHRYRTKRAGDEASNNILPSGKTKPSFEASDLALSQQQTTNILPDIQKAVEELQALNQKNERKGELRHLDIRIAEVFLLYVSIQWGRNYSNPTGIPKTTYDYHSPEDSLFRETIPRYSTDMADYSLIQESAIGSDLQELFLQLLAEKRFKENASLEHKCITWLEARTEQIKRHANRGD